MNAQDLNLLLRDVMDTTLADREGRRSITLDEGAQTMFFRAAIRNEDGRTFIFAGVVPRDATPEDARAFVLEVIASEGISYTTGNGPAAEGGRCG